MLREMAVLGGRGQWEGPMGITTANSSGGSEPLEGQGSRSHTLQDRAWISRVTSVLLEEGRLWRQWEGHIPGGQGWRWECAGLTDC